MNKTHKPLLYGVLALVLFTTGAVTALEGTDRKYTWKGELVEVDESAATMTVRVAAEPHVFRYIDRFTAGQHVMLIWAPGEDKSQGVAIRYLEALEGSSLDSGYVLPVEFVSAEEASQTITLKTPIPSTMMEQVQAASPGEWLAVTVPFKQTEPAAAITAIGTTQPPIRDNESRS